MPATPSIPTAPTTPVTPPTMRYPHLPVQNTMTPPPVAQVESKPKLSKPLLVGLLLLVLVVGGGWAYVSMQPSDSIMPDEMLYPTSELVTETLSTDPSADVSVQTPGYAHRLEDCLATITLPEAEVAEASEMAEGTETMAEGSADGEVANSENTEAWRVPAGGTYPNLLYLFNPSLSEQSYAQANAMYSDGIGSGNVLAAVSVSCTNLVEGVTDLETAMSTIATGIESYNQTTDKPEMMPISYTIESYPEEKWGQNTMHVSLNDEERYVFVANGKLYEVSAFGNSTDEQILEQRKSIFESIKFDAM